jgi:molybdopterin-guanine dinucleotide biosynthesis protein A
MGRNKATLRLGRRTLLGHARASARESGWPHRVIRRDLVPRRGPLGGVHTALSTTNADVVLFLSCDMPFVSAALIRTLLRRWDGRHPGLFVRAGGRTGFPFLLRQDTLPVVERLLADGPWSLHCLAQKLPARLLRLPARWTSQLFNINTPQDWEVARARWKSRERRR